MLLRPTLPVSHLFLTPIAQTLPYLLRHRGVVITGSADRHFGEACLQQIRGLPAWDVIEIPNARHSLELDDDLPGSLQILSLVAERSAALTKD